MLAAYNWGPGNVARHGVKRLPAETKRYIQKVNAQRRVMIKAGPVEQGFVPPNLTSVVAFMEPGPVFGHPVDHKDVRRQ
jgi:hypothetical protein